MKITIQENGPYLVEGRVPLYEKRIVPQGRGYVYENGRPLPQAEQYRLCRCGKTKTPPFCDGTHAHSSFNSHENTDFPPYVERAKRYRGPTLTLLDDELCAFARFCHTQYGDAWSLVLRSDDPLLRKEAIRCTGECPTGRLTCVDNETGEIFEPALSPSINVLQDVERRVSGGLFVTGGIPLFASDGTQYELRNRMVLCRCGLSPEMPFCNAAHAVYGYRDGHQT